MREISGQKRMSSYKNSEITKAGDIENFEYDETKNLLKIDFTEQDCSNKKISNEKLVYDLEKDIFINFKDK
jgi:hypothetical protein